jgi:hypothetical protein
MTSPVNVNRSSGGEGSLGFFQAGLENMLGKRVLSLLVLSSLSRGRSDRKRVVDVDVDVDVVLCLWIVAIWRKEDSCGCIQAWEEARQLPRKIKVTNAHIEVLFMLLLFIIIVKEVKMSTTELWKPNSERTKC